MKTDPFIKIQKKYGGMWIATDKKPTKVYAAGKSVDELFDNLKKKKIPPQKTVIGYMQKYGHHYIYFSL